MSPHPYKKDSTYVMVLCFTLVGGMIVALVLCSLWRYYPATLSGQARIGAVAICPPFLLAQVLEGTTDNTLALVMTIGTIVFANSFLYAGLGSFVYFLMTVFLRKAR